MHAELLTSEVAIPQGVAVDVRNGEFTIKGPKGELKRRLFHPRINYQVEGDKINITSENATRREKKLLFTMRSHLNNMVEGVVSGYIYKLKVCSGHFPMTVSVKGDTFEVKNFLGEAVPRRLKLNPAVKVTVEGADVTVEGIDVEAVGQQAGRIEQLCRRSGFDRRIFQDGIYITHKGDIQL
jgi:large subunit ribosomal protein L6